MKYPLFAVYALLFFAQAGYAGAINPNLETAGNFGVLAGSTVTNTGATVIDQDLGVWPGTSITGFFSPGIVNGTIYDGDAVAMQAETDLTAAAIVAAGESCGDNLTGQDLGGLTLTPGVYCSTSSAQLTGVLTLDNGGDPNAVFVFQIATTLTTATNSSVVFTNGQDDNIFWDVGSSGTLSSNTAFAGNILAGDSITLDSAATIQCGSALAQNGAVTLNDNTISGCTETIVGSSSGSGAPEPGTLLLLSFGLICLTYRAYREKHRLQN